jgi:hypothetical protein
MLTGVRRADAVVLGQPNVHDGWIMWTGGQPGQRAERTRNPASSPAARGPGATPLLGSKTWLVTDDGRPFTIAGFGNQMR